MMSEINTGRSEKTDMMTIVISADDRDIGTGEIDAEIVGIEILVVGEIDTVMTENGGEIVENVTTDEEEIDEMIDVKGDGIEANAEIVEIGGAVCMEEKQKRVDMKRKRADLAWRK